MEGEVSNQDIRRHIVNACIQWARIKGYSDSLGVLRGLALLAKEPISLDELALETGYSKSTVSVNMRQLEELGLVRRIVVSGGKRHKYAPIIDIDTIRTSMLDAINEEIGVFHEALDRTEKDLKASGAEAGYLLERVANLREFYEQGMKMVDVLRKNPLGKVR